MLFCNTDLHQDHRYKQFLQQLYSSHKTVICHNLTSLITSEDVLQLPLPLLFIMQFWHLFPAEEKTQNVAQMPSIPLAELN